MAVSGEQVRFDLGASGPERSAHCQGIVDKGASGLRPQDETQPDEDPARI